MLASFVACASFSNEESIQVVLEAVFNTLSIFQYKYEPINYTHEFNKSGIREVL